METTVYTRNLQEHIKQMKTISKNYKYGQTNETTRNREIITIIKQP